MSPATRLALTLAWSVSSLVLSVAHADDTHYQDFVLGGRSVGMGGAFAAIADDPSGLYFNPAGIADVERSNLQVSTSLYGFERGSIDSTALPVPGVSSLSIKFTDIIIVPASAGFVTSFGSRNPDGSAKQAYGISIIVPSYRSFSALNADSRSSYQRRVTDRELWSGIGYGRKISQDLRLGISAYYVLRSVADREDVTVREDLDAGMGQRFETVTNDVEVVTGSLLLIAGAKYVVSPGFFLGASLQLPSLPVHSQADLHFSRATADPTAAPGRQGLYQTLEFAGTAQTRIAPSLRVGTAYRRYHKFTLTCDLTVHAPTAYVLVNVDPRYRARLPFSPEVVRNTVVNFNLGAETLIVREVSVSAGIFSDFSSAPDVPANPLVDQQPKINLMGLTVALGYFGEHTLSRLGVVYSFGQGYDVIPAGARDFDTIIGGPQRFNRVRYFQSFFYAFLSSSFRY